jgi:hypothetical protein
MEFDLPKKHYSELNQTDEPLLMKSAKIFKDLNSYGLFLKLSRYIWQDIFDFLDDSLFHATIPQVCKYFNSIISDCHTFRSFLNLSPETIDSDEIFPLYFDYIRVEKIIISKLTHEEVERLFKLERFKSRDKILSLSIMIDWCKMEPEESLSKLIDFMLSCFANIASLSLVYLTKGFYVEIDRVVRQSQLKNQSPYEIDKSVSSTITTIFNHKALKSISLTLEYEYL